MTTKRASFEEYHRLVDNLPPTVYVWSLSDTEVRGGVRGAASDDLARGYGQMELEFVRWFAAEVLPLAGTTSPIVLDVGSGLGKFTEPLAATSDVAAVVGVEVDARLEAQGRANAEVVRRVLAAQERVMAPLFSVLGDAAGEPFPWPKELEQEAAHLIFINNFLMDDALTRSIVQALATSGRARAGSRLLLLKPLLWSRLSEENARFFSLFDAPPTLLRTPRNAASWTSRELAPLLYTFGAATPLTPAAARVWREEYRKLLQLRPVNIGERN